MNLNYIPAVLGGLASAVVMWNLPGENCDPIIMRSMSVVTGGLIANDIYIIASIQNCSLLQKVSAVSKVVFGRMFVGVALTHVLSKACDKFSVCPQERLDQVERARLQYMLKLRRNDHPPLWI